MYTGGGLLILSPLAVYLSYCLKKSLSDPLGLF